MSKDSGQRTYYTGSELQYICFVHSLCLLGRMLMYTHGRKLFPVKVNNKKGKKKTNDQMNFPLHELDKVAASDMVHHTCFSI